VNYAYDYFEKDHLGNVRVVLTDQTDLSQYAATMEQETAAKEVATFSNIEETRIKKPVGYPEDKSIAKNAFVAKLSAKDGHKMGPSLVLKVMAGDTIQAYARAFYKSQGPSTSDKDNVAENILAGLANSLGSAQSTADVHANIQEGSFEPFNNPVNNRAYQQLKDKTPDQPGFSQPRAYLNIAMFDEQFKMVENNSSIRRVKEAPDQLQDLSLNKQVASKSGYLYVFTTNESSDDVYFDNVAVSVNSGPLLEESHYYPFGTEMAGISTNVLKGTVYQQNRAKYNGNELQSNEFGDHSGLDIYDFNARFYNSQIGRFYQIDPLSEAADDFTPYAYCKNNPIVLSDFYGLSSDSSGPAPTNLPEVVVTAPKIREQQAINNASIITYEGTNHSIWAPQESQEKSTQGAKQNFIVPPSRLPIWEPPPVIPVEPIVAAEEEGLGEMILAAGPAAISTVGTLILTVVPLPAGRGSYKTNPFAPDPYPGQGNRRENSNPQIVYMFTFIPSPSDPKTPVLKYGISDVKRNGFDRPELQEAGLKALYGPSVKYTILTRTVNRAHALFLEKLLVTKHVALWKEMPREQTYPLPF
jgi:RHS repeat-associated protein